MSDRLEQAKKLLIEEAEELAGAREDHDRVATLHAALMALGLMLAKKMEEWRKHENNDTGHRCDYGRKEEQTHGL